MTKVFLRIQLVLLLFIHCISCHEDKNPCKLPEPVLKDLARVDSFIARPEIRKRDSAFLQDYHKESSLFSAQNETYRFIWASSFDGAKIYKIEKVNGRYKAVTKNFPWQDTVPDIKEFPISSTTWNNIVNRLSNDDFWTYPSSIDRNGLDGVAWILEAYKPESDQCTGKNYHRIYRWSPIDKKFISMCNLLDSLKQE